MTVTVKLTDRAHHDLQEIEDYSLQGWGRKVADRYLEDIQTALSLLQETPRLVAGQIRNFHTLPFLSGPRTFFGMYQAKRCSSGPHD